MSEKTYGTVITSSGAALIAACILNGTKLPITNAAVGDGGGTYYQPTVAQTELKNKKWEGEIANATISTTTANMIDVKIIVPADVGGFIIREAAIYSEDGTLIAVCNTPDTEKVAISEGVSGKLVMLMHLIVADISVLEFTINPSLDMVSAEDMAAAISDHNSSENSHQDIRAALSNKVTINGGEIIDTMNNAIQPGRWTVAVPGSAPGNPPELQNVGTLFGFLDVYVQNNATWLMQIFSPADNYGYAKALYIRKNINNGGWTDWYCFATVTPPQQFDLPLVDGWEIKNYAKYWKNQEGEVSLFFRIGKSSGEIAQGVISTLPVGFRPAVPVHAAAIAYPSLYTALLVVGTDGTITIFCNYAESGDEGSFCGSVSFVAYG